MKRILLILLIATGCAAQTLVGVRDKPSVECDNQVLVARQIKGVIFPPDWTVKIICSDSFWDVIRNAAGLPNAVAITRPARKETLIQGTALTHPKQYQPAFIFAHELGHIKVGDDCREADKYANELLKR